MRHQSDLASIVVMARAFQRAQPKERGERSGSKDDGTESGTSTGPVRPRHHHRPSLRRQAKLVLSPLLAVFILTIFVLVEPINDAIGQYPFLVFVYFHLFFFPAPFTAGEHIENVLVGILGAAFSLGISFLAVAASTWIDGPGVPPYRSAGSRAVAACTLVALCFLGGLFSSVSPRVKSFVRIALFSATWCIPAGASDISFRTFSQLFYPAVFAAAASLIANLVVFPHTANHEFAVRLSQSFEESRHAVQCAVAEFFSCREDQASGADGTHGFEARRHALLQASHQLQEAFAAALLEPGWGRVTPDAFGPLLPILRRIRGWIDCGMGLRVREGSSVDLASYSAGASPRGDGEADAERLDKQKLRRPIEALTQEIMSSLSVVAACINRMADIEPQAHHKARAFGSLRFAVFEPATLRMPSTSSHPPDPSQTGLDAPDDAVLRQRRRLANIVEDFKLGLQGALNQLKAPPEDMFRVESYETAFLMVSLLEIAEQTMLSLRRTQVVLRKWRRRRRRTLFWGGASWATWWSSGGGGVLLRLLNSVSTAKEDGIYAELVDDQTRKDGTSPASSHRRMDSLGAESKLESGGAPVDVRTSRHVQEDCSPEQGKDGKVVSLEQIMRSLESFSHGRQVMRLRRALSRVAHQLKHSRQLRYAIKLSGGVALLSLPAWLPGKPQQWYTDNRGQWLLVTYIWCLETSTGATLQVSFFRIIGTLLGAAYGLACYEVAHGNRFALSFLITIFEIPAAWIMLFTPFPGVGLVSALTQPVISLLPLMNGLDGSQAHRIALTRTWQITLGIVASVIVNLVAWPYHARTKLVVQLSRATEQLQIIYLSLARQMLSAGLAVSPEATARFEHLEAQVHVRLGYCRELTQLMAVEFSLVPPPRQTLQQIVCNLERIADLLFVLRQCRETGMRAVRQEAVVNVLELRAEFVSAVMMSLWVTGQALSTHSRLPQFLPSPRLALLDLTDALRDQLVRSSLTQNRVASGSRGGGGVSPGSPVPEGAKRHPQPDAFHALHSLDRVCVKESILRHRVLTEQHHHRAASEGGHWHPQLVASTGLSTCGRIASPILTPRRAHFMAQVEDKLVMDATAVAAPESSNPRSAVPPASTTAPPAEASKPLDYAYFFVLAEHHLLSRVVAELESVLHLTRDVVGELTMVRADAHHPDQAQLRRDVRTRSDVTDMVLRFQLEDLGQTAEDTSAWPTIMSAKDGVSNHDHAAHLRRRPNAGGDGAAGQTSGSVTGAAGSSLQAELAAALCAAVVDRCAERGEGAALATASDVSGTTTGSASAEAMGVSRRRRSVSHAGARLEAQDAARLDEGAEGAHAEVATSRVDEGSEKVDETGEGAEVNANAAAKVAPPRPTAPTSLSHLFEAPD